MKIGKWDISTDGAAVDARTYPGRSANVLVELGEPLKQEQLALLDRVLRRDSAVVKGEAEGVRGGEGCVEHLLRS
jgi:hypothetical protein